MEEQSSRMPMATARKPPCGVKKGVGYLARHANRLMIANDRLIKIEGDEVYFEYKDCCYRVALS